MNTSITTKVTALMLALVANGLVMGSVALAFSAQAHALSTLPVAAIAAPQINLAV